MNFASANPREFGIGFYYCSISLPRSSPPRYSPIAFRPSLGSVNHWSEPSSRVEPTLPANLITTKSLPRRLSVIQQPSLHGCCLEGIATTTSSRFYLHGSLHEKVPHHIMPLKPTSFILPASVLLVSDGPRFAIHIFASAFGSAQSPSVSLVFASIRLIHRIDHYSSFERGLRQIFRNVTRNSDGSNRVANLQIVRAMALRGHTRAVGLDVIVFHTASPRQNSRYIDIIRLKPHRVHYLI